MKSKKLIDFNDSDLLIYFCFFRLLFRTEHLESLVNQEIGDITNILHTIKMIQDKP